MIDESLNASGIGNMPVPTWNCEYLRESRDIVTLWVVGVLVRMEYMNNVPVYDKPTLFNMTVNCSFLIRHGYTLM